jgi:macrolide-specific efflux system membrane fusion protein
VTDVKVGVGDRVTKGQVMATAANTALKTSLDTAKNDLNSARLQLALADESYANATTTDTRRQTKMQVYSARNQVTQAEQNVADLQAQLGKASLVAPIDGVVTAVTITKGGESSDPAVVVQSSSYEVVASAVESDVTNLSVGQAASVTVSAVNATVDGTVSAIAPVAQTSSSSSNVVSYAVTVKLNAPPATLRPGMSADVTITTASATNVLRVPIAALRGSAGSYSVLVMDATGSTHAQPVTVGLVSATYAEIRNGLTAGDVVVTGTASQQRTTNQQGGGAAIPGGFGGQGGFFRGGGGTNR